MTRTGIVRQRYGELVEVRPCSRFVSDPEMREANSAWRQRATEWGEVHVDERGHFGGAAK